MQWRIFFIGPMQRGGADVEPTPEAMQETPLSATGTTSTGMVEAMSVELARLG